MISHGNTQNVLYCLLSSWRNLHIDDLAMLFFYLEVLSFLSVVGRQSSLHCLSSGNWQLLKKWWQWNKRTLSFLFGQGINRRRNFQGKQKDHHCKRTSRLENQNNFQRFPHKGADYMHVTMSCISLSLLSCCCIKKNYGSKLQSIEKVVFFKLFYQCHLCYNFSESLETLPWITVEKLATIRCWDHVIPN